LLEEISAGNAVDGPHPLSALGPVSTILQELRAAAPPGKFSLDWLLDSLETRSFAIVVLMLAIVSMAPGVSIIAGLLNIILGVQMMAGRPAPAFPSRLGAYRLPTVYLSASVQRIIPVLRQVEKVIRPRWATPPQTTKRAVGLIVVLLSVAVVFCPIPLSNIAPAFTIALIAVAYLEEDGMFLSVALGVAVAMLIVAGVVTWEAILGAQWIGSHF
jgi:hypothetical protein